jgi:hypothetical protein
MEHQPPAGGRRVDALPQRPEAHATLVQVGDDVDQVPQRPAEAVQPPHHQGVPRPQLLEDLIELRAPVQRPGRVVGPHPPTTRGGELVDLQVRVLLARRDPRVAQQVWHAAERSGNGLRAAGRHTVSVHQLRYTDDPTTTLTSL